MITTLTSQRNLSGDGLAQRVAQRQCYAVATADSELKQIIWKIPGVPIMHIARHKYSTQRMPGDHGAPQFLSLQGEVSWLAFDRLYLFASSLDML